MAKGLRAVSKKRNKVALRNRVFAPVEDARTERLAAKLLALAQQPKPARDTDMLAVDGKSEETTAAGEQMDKDEPTEDATEDMDIDAGAAQQAKSSSSKSSKKKGRVEKRRHRKEKNNVTFKTRKPRRTKDKIGRA